MKQFFGKTFWITLIGLALTFGLATLVYFSSSNVYSLIWLVIFAVVVFCISVWRLEVGVLIVFAELFANSHGHLLFYVSDQLPTISLRMVLFTGVMLAWPVYLFARRKMVKLKDRRLVTFYPLMIAILIGFLIGFLNNDPVTAFQDGNAYLYILYILPILSLDWNSSRKRDLLQVLTASAVWTGLLTLGILYTFSHFPEWTLQSTYAFLRDTRTAEITRISDSIFRVFLQSQFFLIILVFFVATFFWIKLIL